MTARKLRYDPNYYDDLVEQARVFSSGFEQKLQQWADLVEFRFSRESIALDAGCGAGSVTRFLLSRCGQVVALDRSKYSIERAHEIIKEAHFCISDLDEALPFVDASFHLIAAYEVIEHLRNPKAFLREAYRVLKAGGSLLIKTPNAWDLWRVLDPLRGKQWYANADKTHVGYFHSLKLARVLRDAGFREIKVRAGTRPIVYSQPKSRWNRRLPLFGLGLVALARKGAINQ
ncbi:MAG: class I SAM-dependent methyltransferase [Candidatus Abyssobacteria bacterium SURF_5]|uniref:Class I SAM-dependent methyltransferase n=1 Tax=Abyssobacteria bacterium (strain SURF_5) TaxID=2093360 RepID=A0A3A4NJ20_ABYX5|nr:MAG: class I SAM-dependent methyltransferase [Candidatus Abyssubacteria bacterium SURF_5]